MKVIKRALLTILKQAGVFRLMAKSRWRNEKLLILCYHGISLENEHDWWPTSFMTSSVLESRLQMLRDGGYSVLPLGEALQKLYYKTLPPKSVVITFDDGLYNFYSQAFPLLQKYNYPATLYLTTYYCSHQLPVFPLICSYMLWLRRDRVIPSSSSLGFFGARDLSTPAGRRLAEIEVSDYAIKMNYNAEQKNDLARRLAEHLDLKYDELAAKRMQHLMTPEEVKDLAKKGLDIQLHTHRHHSPVDRSLFRKEMVENREAIKELLGSEANHHCYPSGIYRSEFLPWLLELSVVSATTCDHAFADSKTNPLLLPRFLDSSNVSPVEFESWLTGVSGLLQQTLRRR